MSRLQQINIQCTTINQMSYTGVKGTAVIIPSLTCFTLTLPILRLLSSKAQTRNDFEKTSKPCRVGIQLIALAEYSQMSTHIPGFQLFLMFLHDFVLVEIASSSIRVKCCLDDSALL